MNFAASMDPTFESFNKEHELAPCFLQRPIQKKAAGLFNLLALACPWSDSVGGQATTFIGRTN